MGFNWITAVLEVAAVAEVNYNLKKLWKRIKERERGGGGEKEKN